MSDIVVTVPKDEWGRWLEEGDLAPDGSEAGMVHRSSGDEYGFTVPTAPAVSKGERVYIVAHSKLRGYAPLLRVERTPTGFALVRGGNAVAITIDQPIQGFRGWRYRWWDRMAERPFPNWRSP